MVYNGSMDPRAMLTGWRALHMLSSAWITERVLFAQQYGTCLLSGMMTIRLDVLHKAGCAPVSNLLNGHIHQGMQLAESGCSARSSIDFVARLGISHGHPA